MKKPTTTYPERPAFFAQKVTRLLVKTCAAQDMGQAATLLVVVVAATEDAARYRRAVTFYNEQLMPLLGIQKWVSLDRARKAAIAAGWLHYEAPPKGKKSPGRYWVTVPAHAEGLEDSPVDEGPPEVYPENGYGSGEPYPPNGYSGGDGRGYGRGYSGGDRGGELPSLNPSPKPSPKTKPGVVGNGQGKKPTKKKATEPPAPIPDSLDTPGFRKAWADFLEHRREMKHPATALAQTRLLNQCEKWGEARAVEAIDTSIGNGWRGLFEPRGGGGAGTASQPELINPADYRKDKR